MFSIGRKLQLKKFITVGLGSELQPPLGIPNAESLKLTVTPFLVIVKGSLVLVPTGDSGVAITKHGVCWITNLKGTDTTVSPLEVRVFVTVPF